MKQYANFVVLVFCFATLSSAYSAAPGRLGIYWIDVEGGASTLLVSPAGESILIDTGNPGPRDASRIVQVATKVAGVSRIDHLVTTHYHRDHYGGAALLSTLMPIGTVYDNGKFDGMPNDPGEDYFQFEAVARQVIKPGHLLPIKQLRGGPKMTIRCLAAKQEFVSPDDAAPQNQERCAECQPKDRDGSDNANSIVLVIECGHFRFLDAGDLTWNQEMRLVCPRDLVGPVDVYQVTHHGLDSSNNPVVLETVQPRVAVMNNGDKKGCLPEVFANLQGTESIESIFQMHKNLRPDGAVNNTSDDMIANHQHSEDCKGHHIELEVAADTMSYTIAVPARGTKKRFETKVLSAAAQ